MGEPSFNHKKPDSMDKSSTITYSDYEGIFEYCSDAVLLTIPDGRILSANPAACMMFQRNEAEICRLGRNGLVDLDDPNLETAVKRRSLSGTFTGILTFIKADGTNFPGEISTRVFQNQEGQNRTVMIIRDVSERQRYITDLSESEKRYRDTLDHMMEGCQFLDHQFTYLYLNDVAIKHSRLSREHLIGHKMTDVYPNIDSTPLFDYLKQCMDNRTSGRFENSFEFPDHTVGDFELLIQPVPEGIFILSLDITERKKAENQLRRNQEILKMFADHAPAAIAMFDNDMRYLATSQRYLSDYGIKEKSVIGQRHYDLFPTMPERWKAIHQRCLKGESLSQEADPFVREDGHIDWVSWEIHPWYRQPNQIGGIILFSEVITLRKNAEDRSKANELKVLSAMVDMVSVISKTLEIRDPYTAGHQGRVTTLAVAIAKELGMNETDIEGIHMASIVHDLGKISIPAEILSKPGSLTPLEYSLIQTHVKNGYDILKEVDFPWPIAEIVYQHHERINGSGYPRGLKGDQLLIQTKILSVADVIEAMASHRPYRPSLGIQAALKEITDQKGILFDESVVEACLKVFRDGFCFDESPSIYL